MLLEPLVKIEDLLSRLDWDLSPAEIRDAEDAIEHASNLARSYGKPWLTAESAPPVVRSLVMTSARRYMANADGYTQSRAGDETLGWDGMGELAAAPFFTSTEIKLIRATVGGGGLYSVPVQAWGPQRKAGPRLVPTRIDGRPGAPFPYPDITADV